MKRPNVCVCEFGWSGQNCSTEICKKNCTSALNGKCDEKRGCVCESGWEGEDCAKPKCDEECNGNGECVGPNLCKCKDGSQVSERQVNVYILLLFGCGIERFVGRFKESNALQKFR